MFGLPIWLDVAVRALVLTSVGFAWTVLLVRLTGLRSLSEMTAVDFVSTVATASLLAQSVTASRWAQFAQGMAAIAALFLLHWLLSRAQRRWKRAAALMRNPPLLVMENGEYLERAMRKAAISRDDIREALRGAAVTDLAAVRAVVLETTGNLTVVQGERLPPDLLEDVRRA